MDKGNEFLSCAVEKILMKAVCHYIPIKSILSRESKWKAKHEKYHVVVNQYVVFLM